jgi:glycosyltransferase involved in cell wall biosynthesis
VAILTTALADGGAEEWMRTLIDHCTDVNWVGVGLPRGAYTTPDGIASFERRLPVVPVPERWDALPADVWITWGTVGGRERPPGGKPVVFVSHGQDTEWTSQAVKLAKPHTTHWAAVSEPALAAYQKAGITGTVILNAIDTTRLHPPVSRLKARLSLGVPIGGKLVVQIARNSTEKRPEALSEVVAALPPEWYGLAAGHHCDQLPRSRRFRGIDHRQDIVTILSAADCVLTMSEGEGCCLAVAEALWFGLPVVATPVGVLSSLPAGSLWWSVAHEASPEAVAAVVIEATDGRTDRQVEITRAFADESWGVERFAREWTAYLTGLVPPTPPTPRTLPDWTPERFLEWDTTCRTCIEERTAAADARLSPPRYCARDLAECGDCISRAVGKFQSRLAGHEVPCDRWEV